MVDTLNNKKDPSNHDKAKVFLIKGKHNRSVPTLLLYQKSPKNNRAIIGGKYEN